MCLRSHDSISQDNARAHIMAPWALKGTGDKKSGKALGVKARSWACYFFISHVLPALQQWDRLQVLGECCCLYMHSTLSVSDVSSADLHQVNPPHRYLLANASNSSLDIQHIYGKPAGEESKTVGSSRSVTSARTRHPARRRPAS